MVGRVPTDMAARSVAEVFGHSSRVDDYFAGLPSGAAKLQ